VAYNRRQPPRRQGIRYGPPREQARFSDNGVLIGRFLGLGILLLTVGVLAAGALAFMRDSPRATSSPGRSAVVASSPSPAPTVLATATPLATALPTPAESGVPASLLPTPVPTNPAPLVQIGEGFVTFGTQADNSLHIVDPKSVFRPNERIVWSAFLSERADSADLLVRITKMDSTAIGGERVISDSPVTPLVRGAQIFQNRIRPGQDLEGPGVYAVRYFRGEEILSEGFLEIRE
jgi:hypothetical protein